MLFKPKKHTPAIHLSGEQAIEFPHYYSKNDDGKVSLDRYVRNRKRYFELLSFFAIIRPCPTFFNDL
jgi:hypothetical protein